MVLFKNLRNDIKLVEQNKNYNFIAINLIYKFKQKINEMKIVW